MSGEWVMYANRVGALPSWRATTDRPDDYRPDFVLVRRLSPSRCVLLDAKASVDAVRSAFALRAHRALDRAEAAGLDGDATTRRAGPTLRAQ